MSGWNWISRKQYLTIASSRLISSIKDTHALTDGSAMSELWNTKVRDDAADDVDDEADIDFRDELRKASGIGKRKGKGKVQAAPCLQLTALLTLI